ncbi:hypothetical protein MTR67_052843 [Solanum verrucosum]|uniref:Gag-pol polyprotein n=1 Tax=Solanum verrucosum TaxID=315347 RepID=A0AAF0V9U9_SOLVR|nr:hypothetical protein MTR67_052843 [Solanum verrucosum]
MQAFYGHILPIDKSGTWKHTRQCLSSSRTTDKVALNVRPRPVLVVRGSPLQPLPSQLRKLVKCRPTDRPTVRRSDHDPWSVSVDQDLLTQPLTSTTVDQHGPSFDPRSRQNRLYALQARQDQEDSPDVVTGTLRVFDLDVYALLDPGATLSFVTPYIAVQFIVSSETLSEPFSVSTPVGDPVIARRAWIGYILVMPQ